MSENSNEPNDNLTEGWPPEPGNPDLARFAEELRASQPQLPPESLEHVERRIMEEGGAFARRRRLRRIAIGAGMAAAVVLSVALYAFLPRPRSDTSGNNPVTQASPVRDVYRVDFTAPPAPPPQSPLIRVEEYRSLFSD
jgi:hypothetical protein